MVSDQVSTVDQAGGRQSDSPHTPGPWEAAPTERGEYYVRTDGPGPIIADSIGSKEDAILIAAAPELLAALMTISLHASSLDAIGIRQTADEAITKATGRAYPAVVREFMTQAGFSEFCAGGKAWRKQTESGAYALVCDDDSGLGEDGDPDARDGRL